MPRLALIADIHANLEALHAVVADIARHDADRIICLGDIVGYGPDPADCIELVHTVCDHIVLGNHDEAATHPQLLGSFNPRARASLQYTHDVLSDDHLHLLAKLPDRAKTDGVSFTHASFGPSQYEYLYDADAAAASFTGLRTRFGAVGHTHIPTLCQGSPQLGGITDDISITTMTPNLSHSLEHAGVAIVNPGSVGQPRDRNPDAAWAMLDTDNLNIRAHRVAYDIDTTLHKMAARGLPDTLAHRLRAGA